jgi:hypothetical protein
MATIEMNWEQWEEEFQPLTNGDEMLWLETYGDDLERVNQAAPDTVWTIIDGGGRFLDIVSGKRFVNRLNYVITKKPAAPETDYYITNQN